MAGGLIAAAMLSGLGQGIGDAAKTGMQFMGASMLQKERADLETKRIQLMEGLNTARETRGYAHAEKLAAESQQNARDMQASGFEQQDRLTDKTNKHADDTLGKTQGFTASENEKTRDQHKADQIQARLITERTLANAEEGTASTREHQEATERIARAQLAATRDKATLMPMSDGTIYRVDAQGKVLGKAMDPDTGKPLAGVKDLPATTKLLVEVNKTLIQQKGEQLKNQSLLPEERASINAEMTRLKVDIEGLLGRAPAKSGPTQIVDPAATPKASDAMTAKGGPSTPAPGADEHLAKLRQEADQRAAALKSSTQQAGQAAMDAENPGAVASVAPANRDLATPTPAQMAKMERQKPRGMQQPGEPDDPQGLLAAVKSPPPPPTPQSAALPRELPRAAAPTAVAGQPPMVEPEMLDPNGPADPFVSTQSANVPRELQRAAPGGLLAASKPPMAEPGITDPNGPPVESGAPPAKASQPTGRALTPKDLQSLLTTDQKAAIVDMQRRIRSNGISEKPATPGQLQNLLIQTYGPIFQRNNQSPAELADAIDMMMQTLLPERPNRKDRK